LKLYCSTGVWPFGAQVLTRVGRSLSPDSSTKTIVRPSARHFFWRRPTLLLPGEDRHLVALDGAARGALVGESQLAQDPPDMHGAVHPPKLDFEQRAHARQRPQLGRKAAGHRPGDDPLRQPGALGLGQAAWLAQRLAPPCLRIVLAGAFPVRHCLPTHVELARHLGLGHTPRQHPHALAPPLLQ
jgi:hypothetical protein